MRKIVFLFLAITAMPFDATAQSLPFGDVAPGIVKPSFGCGATVESEASRRRCAKEELLYVDGRLNALYYDLRKELKPDEVSALSSTQRKWIKQRDVACMLGRKNRSRDAWLTYVASSPTRTNCVLHTSRKRMEELECLIPLKMTAKSNSK